MKLSFAQKLTLILAATGLLVTIALAGYLIHSGRTSARLRAQTKGVELIERSAQMFMVSTRKFHDVYTNAPNEMFRKGALDDWNRTILAVDTAVINDFGPDKPRVRLIGDLPITGVKPLGGDAIKIKTPFEEQALKEIMAGKPMVEQFTDDTYSVAVPLLNNMHPGCAECHGISTEGRIVMGSVNAYVPLVKDYAEAKGLVLSIGLWVGVSMIAMVVCIGVFVHRSMVKPVKALSDSLFSSADQTSCAAAQVASASAGLAEGASDQAASLEETRASLEEVSNMTRSNADRAGQANELAKSARSAADEGSAQMQAMAGAMKEIKASSDEIAKIIKTIDEIAFQTNILALNAAVEAARAGEAGMGFSVVADEVRNLAQRSAHAARETTAKIESAISKTNQGGRITEQVLQTLESIVTKVRKVDELIAEVADASQEQKQGIDQVNTAICKMDEVTQGTAAGAEESASAAEELNSQAAALKDAVAALLRLVGDSSAGSDGPSASGAAGNNGDSAASQPSKKALSPAAVRLQPKAHPVVDTFSRPRLNGHAEGEKFSGRNGRNSRDNDSFRDF